MFGKRKGSTPSGEPAAPQTPDSAGMAPAAVEETLSRPLAPGVKPAGGAVAAAGPTAGPTAGKAAPRRQEGRQAPAVEGRKLVVGREICLSGEIKTCEKLVVEGKVEADLSDSQSLEISEPGFFKGNATVEDCEISGTFEGELTVTGILVVHPTGRVSGRIRYAEMILARGARLRGDIDHLDETGAGAGEGAGQRPARGAGPKLAHDNGDPRGDSQGDAAAGKSRIG